MTFFGLNAHLVFGESTSLAHSRFPQHCTWRNVQRRVSLGWVALSPWQSDTALALVRLEDSQAISLQAEHATCMVLRMNGLPPLGMDTFANLVMPRGVLYTFPSKGAMMQLLHRIGTQLFSVIFTALDCYCSMCYWDLVLIALAELRSETQQLWFRGKTRQTLCGFCPDLVAPTNFRIGSNFWQIGCCLMCSLRGITISDLTRSLRDRRMPVWQQIIQYWGGFRSSRRTTSCTANWDN